jgi:hypothetical protein
VAAPEFNAISDRRMKSDIVSFSQDASVEIVKRLNPVAFTFKYDTEPGVGFIAQEFVAAGLGALVRSNYDESPELVENTDGNGVNSPANQMLTVNYNGVIPYLTSALQNALARIEALEAQINGGQ